MQGIYELDRIVLSPDMSGYPVRRVRQFILARHKLKTMKWRHSIALPDFFNMFKQSLVATWRAFLVATLEEQDLELEWAGSRPSVLPFLTNIEHEGRFHSCLSPTEKEILECYRTSSPEGTCFSLNQDIRNGRGRRSGVQLLRTVVKMCGIVWCRDDGIPEHSRLLTTRKLLVAQGFPIHEAADTPQRSTNHMI